MLIRLGSMVLAFFATSYAFVASTGQVSALFLAASFTLIALLIAIKERDIFSISILGVLYALPMGWEFLRGDYYGVLLQGLTLVTCIGLWRLVLAENAQAVRAIEYRKECIAKDIEALQEKHNARMESLEHLEHQVGSLLELFETAKDFNECLDFSQLLTILERKVKEQIPFDKLSLSLSASQSTKAERSEHAMSIGRTDIDNMLMRAPCAFELACEVVTEKHKGVLRWEKEVPQEFEFPAEAVSFPLWIFPLQVEGKTVAVLSVEGAAADDFPKFEVLASQLALQVKKISLYETVKELSIIDGLTKTYVRRHFLERLEEEIKRAMKHENPLSVLMLDIDHFKSYNDKFGHLVGNSTLREVAGVVREHVRKVDFVARYGGEEFVIAMPEIGYPENLEIAERIRSAVARKKFRLYDEETQVTVSIGVSAFPKDLEHQAAKGFDLAIINDMITKADQALYRAKEEGRNRVVGSEQLKHKRK